MLILDELQPTSFLNMYLVIDKTIFCILLIFSRNYLRKFSTSGVGVFGYIDVI
jgi:hypothetical protein